MPKRPAKRLSYRTMASQWAEQSGQGVIDFFSSPGFMRLGMLVLSLSLMLWLWEQLCDSDTFPITTVTIKGHYTHISRATLEQVVSPVIGVGFWGVDVQALHAKLVNVPWVASAAVRRLWPNQLKVTINEQKPIARWNKADLLNTKGKVFTPPQGTQSFHFIQLRGPDSEALTVLRTYQTFSVALSGLPVHIVELTLTPQRSWRFRLNTGLEVILGQEDVLEHLQRFAKVYNTVFNGAKLAVRADLRYTNGMAVLWAAETPLGKEFSGK